MTSTNDLPLAAYILQPPQQEMIEPSEIRVMLEATLDVKSVIIFLTKSHEERRTNVSCFLLKVKRNVKQFLRQSIPFSLNIAISTAEK
jgi:hypothetical protein